jgi:hypothetical protein
MVPVRSVHREKRKVEKRRSRGREVARPETSVPVRQPAKRDWIVRGTYGGGGIGGGTADILESASDRS